MLDNGLNAANKVGGNMPDNRYGDKSEIPMPRGEWHGAEGAKVIRNQDGKIIAADEDELPDYFNVHEVP